MPRNVFLAGACALAFLLAGCPQAPAPVAHTRTTPAQPASPGTPATPPAAGAVPQDEPATPPATAIAMALILDTSGSMADPVGGDGAKLDIAKRVLTNDFLPTLSDDLYLAYYEFMNERSSLQRSGRIEQPGWSHREVVMEAVDHARANGGTPIVGSLSNARQVLGGLQVARKVVVLVTDGMDDNGPAGVERELDACKAAGLECYVVGFQLGDQGKYLEAKLGLGTGYFQANGGRDALLAAMKSVAAAVER